MKSQMTVSISLVLQMQQYLVSLGIETEELLQHAGIPPSMLESPDNRLPIDLYMNFQKQAELATEDGDLGLHIGESAVAGSWSILGYIMMNCRTLGDALERVGKYNRIVSDLIQTHVRTEGGLVHLVFARKPGAPEMTRQCSETMLASFFTMLRNITGKRFALTQVLMPHQAPEKIEEHQRIFGCPLLFNQPHSALVFERNFLQIQIFQANPALLEVFEHHAGRVLAGIGNESEYTQKVSRLLFGLLQEGNGVPEIRQVARQLAMSVRSLQTRLADEKTNFKQIVREVRKEMAKSYLQDTRYTIADISYLLGFSEPSVFRRSFKTWTGTPPGQYRSQLLSL